LFCREGNPVLERKEEEDRATCGKYVAKDGGAPLAYVRLCAAGPTCIGPGDGESSDMVWPGIA
jgi:hypothetical protein